MANRRCCQQLHVVREDGASKTRCAARPTAKAPGKMRALLDANPWGLAIAIWGLALIAIGCHAHGLAWACDGRNPIAEKASLPAAQSSFGCSSCNPQPHAHARPWTQLGQINTAQAMNDFSGKVRPDCFPLAIVPIYCYK